ncbi:MAG: RNA 2',3'-cyclic phosphodiesterase [Melioribacteraceae bacterium]|nr:MAG: RNA 2',3'-cyclic phosphodiesterase [Melioribacteraceae bacterium]
MFVALEIPDDIIEQLVEFREEIYGKDDIARWEPVEKLHITLKFIGDINDSLIPEIEQKLKLIAENNDPLDLEFKKFGLFYRDNKPSILWAGLRQDDNLIGLVNQIEDSLSILGLKKEKRKFKPHLTLLRVRGRENYEKLEEFKQYIIDDLDFEAGKITLFKSELKRGGSVYTAIKSFELQAWRNNVFRKGCKIKNIR